MRDLRSNSEQTKICLHFLLFDTATDWRKGNIKRLPTTRKANKRIKVTGEERQWKDTSHSILNSSPKYLFIDRKWWAVILNIVFNYNESHALKNTRNVDLRCACVHESEKNLITHYWFLLKRYFAVNLTAQQYTLLKNHTNQISETTQWKQVDWFMSLMLDTLCSFILTMNWQF